MALYHIVLPLQPLPSLSLHETNDSVLSTHPPVPSHLVHPIPSHPIPSHFPYLLPRYFTPMLFPSIHPLHFKRIITFPATKLDFPFSFLTSHTHFVYEFLRVCSLNPLRISEGGLTLKLSGFLSQTCRMTITTDTHDHWTGLELGVKPKVVYRIIGSKANSYLQIYTIA